MISDIAQAHGSFFILLFEALKKPVFVERLSEEKFGANGYLLDNKIPVYLKHATKRNGPWYFNFARDHQKAQQLLFNTYGECFTCLVCGRDGIVGMNMDELRQVLDHYFEEQEIVSVHRPLGKWYKIKGRDGVLENKISRRAIFDKIRAVLE